MNELAWMPRFYLGPLGALGGLSIGSNNGNDIMSGFLELNCVNRTETTLAYVQGRVLRQRVNRVWQRAESVGVRVSRSGHRNTVIAPASLPVLDCVQCG